MKLKKTITFDDVLLVPRYSDIESRSEIDLSSNLGNINFSIPIVSSPMDTVTETSMAVSLDSCGGLGIVHRYNTIPVQSRLIHEAHHLGAKNIGAAIGVTGDYLDRAKAAHMAGSNIFCVDIAHGHHSLMKNALKCLRSMFGDSVEIIAGNVATLDAFNDLADWGASAVRVGIGGGSICSTRIQTGHGVPTLQSVFDCAKSDRNVTLIADGGIKTSGDVAKAVAAGADFVMLGSMLSGTDESPGEVLELPVNGSPGAFVRKKVYRGMASVEAQIDWRGHTASVEGVSSTVNLKGPVSDILESIEKGLRSGMSYTGARNMSEFMSKSMFIAQSPSSQVESSTHINLV